MFVADSSYENYEMIINNMKWLEPEIELFTFSNTYLFIFIVIFYLLRKLR